MLIFPDNPGVGTTFLRWSWDGAKWVTPGYVPLTGADMLGQLRLFANATDPLGAVTLQQMNTAIAGFTGAYLPLTGGTLASPGDLNVGGALRINPFNGWEWQFLTDGSGNKIEQFRAGGWYEIWHSSGGTHQWVGGGAGLMSLDGAGNLWTAGNIAATGQSSGNTVVANYISSAGNIDAAGQLGGNTVVANGISCTGQISGNTVVANGITSHGNIGAAGQVSAGSMVASLSIQSNGIISAAGLITAAGVATLVNIDAGNDLFFNRHCEGFGNIASYTGSGFKPGDGMWEAYSDRRTKGFEEPYERGLEAILALQPVRYRYNGKAGMPTDKTFIGLTADDVLPIMPELIGKKKVSAREARKSGDEGEEYLTIQSSPVLWAMVNAMKQLNARLAALEAAGHGD